MGVDEFRKVGSKELTDTELVGRLETYAFEMCLLQRLATARGIAVSVDLVERKTYTEIVVSHDRG